MKHVLCIAMILLGSVAVCQLDAGRTPTIGKPFRGKPGRDPRLLNLAAMAQAIKQIRMEQLEFKQQRAVLTGEKIDADGELPWAFRKLFELLDVSDSKIKLAEKRYASYLKTRDTYREKLDKRREELVKIRDKKLAEKDGITCLKACEAIKKLDEDFWKAYNRNYANMLGGIDNYLSSKQRLEWPATSLLAEALSHFTTEEEKEVFTDDVFKKKIADIAKEAKTIAKLKTYEERIRKRKQLYDAICREFKLRKGHKTDSKDRKGDRKEDRKDGKKTKDEPDSKEDDGFGGW